jgi:acyl transferase domain-containing protein
MVWFSLPPIVGTMPNGTVRAQFSQFRPCLDIEIQGTKTEPGKYAATLGGFVSNIDLFDPLEFGISQKEAQYLDPSLRLTLEAAHQARTLYFYHIA